MKFSYLLAIFFAWSLSAPALAQNASPAAAGTPTTASQRQLAATILGAVYSEETFNKVIDQVLVAQLQAHPDAKPYENEIRTFLGKYMSWASLKPDLAEAYAREFTEPELRELLLFYQSPIGKKAAAKIPSLMQVGMEIGQRHVREHMAELQKLIQDKATADAK